MRYPDGRQYQQTSQQSSRTKHSEFVQHGQRGMRLETMLNRSNDWYRTHNRAVIYKKPTPIQVVSVDYPKREKVTIKEAYYRQPSTTDYNGVYRGYYIDFEAKQTAQTTRFPLNNFHAHQIAHMQACDKQGGICFAIMLFSALNEAYLYPFNELQAHWQDYQNKRGAASIPLIQIRNEGFAISIGAFPDIDYLPAVDQYIQQMEQL
ncbi:MAG: Holliday junction resolvase RecU [Aerococcus sp.]|nr:Holliday junction resolvase RecU [Aerococcus sp.]